MTFRRFVLLPAAEIAPRMQHPVIGWPIERLLLHLNEAKDEVAMLSPSESLRYGLAASLAERFGAQAIERPAFKTADTLWPPQVSTWLAVSRDSRQTAEEPAKNAGLPYAAAAFPKLTILLDAQGDCLPAAKTQWSSIVRQPGRGPTLRLQSPDRAEEVFAAIESVWWLCGFG